MWTCLYFCRLRSGRSPSIVSLRTLYLYQCLSIILLPRRSSASQHCLFGFASPSYFLLACFRELGTPRVSDSSSIDAPLTITNYRLINQRAGYPRFEPVRIHQLAGVRGNLGTCSMYPYGYMLRTARQRVSLQAHGSAQMSCLASRDGHHTTYLGHHR
ncbi:hypothetical protein LX36DRAFT_60729 [Colletotrichum falcatum]|nr:hypothetical protein LX36DRAFT_60729 [Colletotrichum falcatum]